MTELVELRSYRLVDGQTDEFVRHFEAHFLASQEALGMDIVGQFTVVDDDARFVWVRRHRDPEARTEALTSFYTGAVWERHGPRANELMIDFSDVHLLVPHGSLPTFAADHVPHAERLPSAGVDHPPSTVIAAVFDVAGPGGLAPEVAGSMARTAGENGVVELGRLVTADVPNRFPVLPVHDDPVAVWLLSDRTGGPAAATAVNAVASAHGLPVTTTVLTPTARSTLR